MSFLEPVHLQVVGEMVIKYSSLLMVLGMMTLSWKFGQSAGKDWWFFWCSSCIGGRFWYPVAWLVATTLQKLLNSPLQRFPLGVVEK